MEDNVAIWRSDQEMEDYCFDGHTGFVSSVEITTNRKYLLSGGYDHTVRIWNLRKKRQVSVLQVFNDIIYSLALTSDKKYIVSGGCDTIRIWKLVTKHRR